MDKRLTVSVWQRLDIVPKDAIRRHHSQTDAKCLGYGLFGRETSRQFWHSLPAVRQLRRCVHAVKSAIAVMLDQPLNAINFHQVNTGA
jgi:hypothetical protein